MEEVTTKELRDFLMKHLREERKVSERSSNYYNSVIRFIYDVVLDKPSVEEQVRANKRRHIAKEAIKDTKDGVKQGHIELRFMKEIMKIKEFTEMRCSFLK